MVMFSQVGGLTPAFIKMCGRGVTPRKAGSLTTEISGKKNKEHYETALFCVQGSLPIMKGSQMMLGTHHKQSSVPGGGENCNRKFQ